MRSSSSHSSRSSCTGGKLGEWKAKENLAPEVTEGDTGALATLRMAKEDIGSIMADWLTASVCWAALQLENADKKYIFRFDRMFVNNLTLNCNNSL